MRDPLYTKDEIRKMPDDDLLRRCTLIYGYATKKALLDEARKRGLI